MVGVSLFGGDLAGIQSGPSGEGPPSLSAVPNIEFE